MLEAGHLEEVPFSGIRIRFHSTFYDIVVVLADLV